MPFPLRDRLYMWWSRLRSYFRVGWRFEDYPIREVQQLPEGVEVGRFGSSQAWRANILGWPDMVGLGATREQARADLRHRLEALREAGEPLPRPGVARQLSLASDDRVSAIGDLRDEFLAKVLEVDPEEVWISDDSTLWHFAGDSGTEDILRRIEQHFGVRVTEDDSPIIADILERVAAHRSEQAPHG